MQLETNRAWQEASAKVAANRQVLLALAGVFFVLPGLALSLFFPEPQPEPGIAPKELMALLGEYYRSIAPWTIPVFIASSIGVLAVLTLLADRDRPTVSEAIRQGAGKTPAYLGTQLIISFAFGIVGALAIMISAAAGSVGLGVVLVAAVLVAAIYVGTRLTLAGPVIAAEGVRNPITALQRSWALTQGNAGRILLFVFLIALVFVIIIAVIMGVTGVILALTLGGEPARVIAALVSSVLSGAFTVYLTACLSAVHSQLSGREQGLGATFE